MLRISALTLIAFGLLIGVASARPTALANDMNPTHNPLNGRIPNSTPYKVFTKDYQTDNGFDLTQDDETCMKYCGEGLKQGMCAIDNMHMMSEDSGAAE